jgi:hypothetical protein
MLGVLLEFFGEFLWRSVTVVADGDGKDTSDV